MPPKNVTANRRSPIRVLTLDDERSVRDVYSAVLSNQGYETETSPSARDALRTLMQSDFDILVVDLRMPEMDGFAFLEEALKIRPGLSVVISSGYVNDEAVERAERMGIKHVLRKPVEPQALIDSVVAAFQENKNESTIASLHSKKLCDYLRGLSRIAERATETTSLVDALRRIGDQLTGLLPHATAGILLIESEEKVLFLSKGESVSPDFVSAVKEEMFVRYEALTGRQLERSAVRVEEEEGDSPVREAEGRPRSIVSIPILLQEEIRGLLTFASTVGDAYSPDDVSLLYHAANHISSIMLTLSRMRRMVVQDALTGVLNRIGLEQELERTWLVSRRYDFAMGVVIIDLDNFKMLNDSYGHTVGDEILREFSDVVIDTVRASDIVARYGGDEFVIIMPKTDEGKAKALAERVLQAVRGHRFCEKTQPLSTTATIGVATSDNPTAPATSSVLLSQADRAMYMAKRAGRNRVFVWPTDADRSKLEMRPPSLSRSPITQPKEKTSLGRVLLVDDEPAVLQIVKRILQTGGYTVQGMESAVEATEELKKNAGAYDILLTDLSLPGKSGIDLLHDISDNDSIIKIAMTGYATVTSAVECLREGAYDFIQKPIDRSLLLAVVERAMKYHELTMENVRYQTHLEEMVQERSAQLAESLEEIRRSYDFTLEALVAMLDAREHQTGKHSMRTRDLAVTLATAMGIGGDELEDIAHGALLHDIGKIAIPDSILLSPKGLLPEEWEIMKKHPQIGYNILRASPYLRGAARVVREHQERYDGTGYPHGLRGDEICMGARIFGVIDAYDAMRSARVYRKPVTPEDAAAEIQANSGTQFDPEVVKAFLRCQEDLEKYIEVAEE